MAIPVQDSVVAELLRESNLQARRQTRLLEEIAFTLERIEKALIPPHHYTVQIRSLNMANPIPAGSTGQLGAALLDNGAPVTGFTGTFTFTCPDTLVTFAAATTDASGGTIPLANQVVVSVAGSETAISAVITATTTAPDGTTATGTLTITITPTPQKFTVGVTQLLP
jgi:hypothetical protein